MIYEFARYELDSGRCALTADGVPIALRQKCFEVLLYLVERPQRVITKDEFLDRLWPRVTVDDASLTQAVSNLRRALAPDGDQLIKTVHGRGYMLESSVRSKIAPPAIAPHRPVRARWQAAALLASGAVFGWLFVSLSTDTLARPAVPVRTTTDTLGQLLAYPEGQSLVATEIKVLNPYQSSPWHTHDAPVIAYVLQGKVEIQYGGGEVRTFEAGETVVEAVNRQHMVRNIGWRVARFFVVTLDADPKVPLQTAEAKSR